MGVEPEDEFVSDDELKIAARTLDCARTFESSRQADRNEFSTENFQAQTGCLSRCCSPKGEKR